VRVCPLARLGHFAPLTLESSIRGFSEFVDDGKTRFVFGHNPRCAGIAEISLAVPFRLRFRGDPADYSASNRKTGRQSSEC
jgi:hypothetical protein